MKGYLLTWLPDVLRARGLEVLEHPGWQTRGHGDVGNVLGVLCHHTCGPLHGDLPDVDVLVNGRPDLGGPLCNLGLGRSGKFYMIAAGKGWHAGRGAWQGVTDGNEHMIGIEAENTGETSGPRAETWPEIQLDAYARGCAAILDHVGADHIMAAGHKEFALPKGRKNDPSFDMIEFRKRIADLMRGHAAPIDIKSAIRHGVINTNGLNVRSSASVKGSTILNVLDAGAQVSVLFETMNGSTKWYKIDDGYVAAKYVDLK